MTGIMQPDKSSKENIELFIESIEDDEIKILLKDQIKNILVVGANSENRENREAFLTAIQDLIDQRIEDDE